MSRGPKGIREAADRLVDEFSPAGFAMVMATGIVSAASHALGMQRLGLALFALAVAAYVIQWVLGIACTLRHPRRILGQLLRHTGAFAFFTTVAATCVLGSGLIGLFEQYRLAWGLWIFGLVLWVTLTYTVFTALTIRKEKPTLAEGISGAWLLAVVSTQSIALLSAELATHAGATKLPMNFFALSMWLWGGMLYIWMISLIFYRYAFFGFSPGDLTPPYWINMGAMAISSLVGAVLITNAPEAPFLLSTLPFLKGFTIFYWATGTWWLPMLVILACWRHLYERFPVRYDPLYWGAVFPLGMYTASTLAIAQALHLSFLEFIPRYFVYVALAVWAATFAGLVATLVRRPRHP
jgi:tellurite resistance protein TehA-like permease